ARIEGELAEAGLPPLSWYDVLWAVRRAPGRRVRMAELAHHLTISRGGLSKLADRLEDAGLLQREPAAEDGRGYHAAITDAGTEMLRRMWTVYSRVLRQSFAASIDANDAQVIAAALDRAKEAAAGDFRPASEP